MAVKQNLDMTMFFPEVYQAVAGENHMVYAYVCDGSVRLYDMKPLLEKGGVFEALRNEDVFRSTITVMNGTVAWDIAQNRDPSGCIDIDPLDIFRAQIVEDFPTMDEIG